MIRIKQNLWKASLLLLLLAAVGYAAFGNPRVAANNAKLKAAVLKISAETVCLNDVVPFSWDTLYTFEPYTTREEMEKIIGFQSGSLKESVSEGMVQLLFVKDEKVVASVCGYRDALGYSIDFHGKITTRERASFDVTKEEGFILLKKQ